MSQLSAKSFRELRFYRQASVATPTFPEQTLDSSYQYYLNYMMDRTWQDVFPYVNCGMVIPNAHKGEDSERLNKLDSEISYLINDTLLFSRFRDRMAKRLFAGVDVKPTLFAEIKEDGSIELIQIKDQTFDLDADPVPRYPTLQFASAVEPVRKLSFWQKLKNFFW